jgi:hypothetical protein
VRKCYSAMAVTVVCCIILSIAIFLSSSLHPPGFHMFCLDPPLTVIPKGQWFCHTCLFGTGDDFGFDEGEEHCLSSFQARDLEFRKLWFESHPPVTPRQTYSSRMTLWSIASVMLLFLSMTSRMSSGDWYNLHMKLSKLSMELMCTLPLMAGKSYTEYSIPQQTHRLTQCNAYHGDSPPQSILQGSLESQQHSHRV